MLLGIHLTLLLGKGAPLPAPPPLAEALVEAEVTHADEGRSGFSLTFETGRGTAGIDHALLMLPQLRPNSRVILVVTLSATPWVLMDGFITQQQLTPGDRPGSSRITVTGEDASRAMDLKERSAEHPAQDETIIATKLIASYAMVPMVIPPPAIDPPLPTDWIPVQRNTDLGYLNEIAFRHGYVFYVIPGPVPGANVGYWGPKVRAGAPQRALSVDLGGETNVKSIQFQADAQGPLMVSGHVQDPRTGQSLPVRTFASTRLPLSVLPLWLVNLADIRVEPQDSSGLSVTQAYSRAQGRTNAAADALTATGELDAVRYGRLLRPRALVGVRGAGWMHDGLWYVQKVRHALKRGSYAQHFTLARDGYGSTVPVVVP